LFQGKLEDETITSYISLKQIYKNKLFYPNVFREFEGVSKLEKAGGLKAKHLKYFDTKAVFSRFHHSHKD
jgi:hypothetical protein